MYRNLYCCNLQQVIAAGIPVSCFLFLFLRLLLSEKCLSSPGLASDILLPPKVGHILVGTASWSLQPAVQPAVQPPLRKDGGLLCTCILLFESLLHYVQAKHY